MTGSRSKPKPNSEAKCRHCRAPNDLDAPECWLCQRRDWRGAGGVPRPSFDPPLPRRDPFAPVRGLPGMRPAVPPDGSPVPNVALGTFIVLSGLLGFIMQATGTTVAGVLLGVVVAVFATILHHLRPTRGDRP